jgi:hypothetical protein
LTGERNKRLGFSNLPVNERQANELARMRQGCTRQAAAHHGRRSTRETAHGSMISCGTRHCWAASDVERL